MQCRYHAVLEGVTVRWCQADQPLGQVHVSIVLKMRE